MELDRRVSVLDLYKVWPLLRRLEGERLERIYSCGEVVAATTRSAVFIFSPRRGPAVLREGAELPPGTQRLKQLSQLEGKRVTSVEQVNGDRVLSLQLGSFELVLEWVRDGNVVLLDSSGRIAYAMKHQKMRDRSLVRGEHYKPPPKPGDAFSDPPSQLFSLFRSSGRRSAVTAMSLAASLPAEVVYEAFYRRGVDPGLRADSVDESTFRSLLSEARDIFLEGLADYTGGYWRPGGGAEIYAFPARHRSAVERFEGFAEKLSELIVKLAVSDAAPSEAAPPVDEVEEALREAEEAARLLQEHAWRVDQVLERYRELRSEKLAWAALEEKLRAEFPEVVSVDPSKNTLTLRLGEAEVSVLAAESAAANAGRYFERVKALRRRLEELKSAAPRVRPSVVISPRPKRREAWYSQFRFFWTSGGFLVVAGRTAGQNELLVRRYMDPSDIFLHADIHGAPATVIKTGGRQPSEQDISEAAQFAACYSSAWKAGMYTVDVFWVPGAQVSKSPPSGEYLGKGSFMVYGKRNYVKGIKLELLVGYSSSLGLVALPAIAAPREGCFLKLAPGRLSRDLAARKVVEFLRRECGARGFRDEDVLRLLPEGGFHVERWRPL
ncbi:MAG: ribosome rescue protein RqcH [Thermofilum sp.]